jgi:hypothetical protein
MNRIVKDKDLTLITHNTVIEDNVIIMKLLRKSGHKAQLNFALGIARFFELVF